MFSKSFTLILVDIFHRVRFFLSVFHICHLSIFSAIVVWVVLSEVKNLCYRTSQKSGPQLRDSSETDSDSFSRASSNPDSFQVGRGNL